MVIEVKQNGKFVKIPYVTADIPVDEAPVDGKQYGRQNETWTEIVKTDLSGLEAAIETKVDKEAGKGLSTNDYTTTEKTKLEAIPAPADIVVDSDSRLTIATTSKDGLMSAADKVQLDSTLTSTEIENKVNAAVSSVYRVKGNVATVNDLPTANVAIGDVWNISDTGANYVAVSKDPVEWDKLSETVDLTPYMLTSDANNTFVKKVGDVMTNTLVIDTQGDAFLIRKGGVDKGIIAADTDYVYLYNVARKKALQYTDSGELKFENNVVYHAGNDGAGSGLDADTVDGIQTERIIYGDNDSKTTNVGNAEVTSSKANTIKRSGFYRCNVDSDEFTSLLIHCHHSNGSQYGYAFQIGTGYSIKDPLSFRVEENGVWGPKKDLIDTSTVLTQAEYDALGSTVNSDNKIYFIKE